MRHADADDGLTKKHLGKKSGQNRDRHQYQDYHSHRRGEEDGSDREVLLKRDDDQEP